MSGGDERYAIYFVPPADRVLYRFGSSVLGYDCRAGRDCDFLPGGGPDWPGYVREPRIYGFHATLKPPFRLRNGASRADLEAALQSFGAARRMVDGGALQLAVLGKFIALVPAVSFPAVDALAADCVRAFDGFRKPMDAAERERRAAASLTPSQRSKLDAWGYPYVFGDFRFHMTLTGPLADRHLGPALSRLAKEWAQRPAAHALLIDRVVLLRQAGGPFTVVSEAVFPAS